MSTKYLVFNTIKNLIRDSYANATKDESTTSRNQRLKLLAQEIRWQLRPYILDIFLERVPTPDPIEGDWYRDNKSPVYLPLDYMQLFTEIASRADDEDYNQVIDQITAYYTIAHVAPADRDKSLNYFINYRTYFTSRGDYDYVWIFRVELLEQSPSVFAAINTTLLSAQERIDVDNDINQPVRPMISEVGSLIVDLIKANQIELLEDYVELYFAFPLLKFYQYESIFNQLLAEPQSVAAAQNQSQRMALVLHTILGSMDIFSTIWSDLELLITDEVLAELSINEANFYQYYSSYPAVRKIFSAADTHQLLVDFASEASFEDKLRIQNMEQSFLPLSYQFEKSLAMAKNFKGLLAELDLNGRPKSVGSMLSYLAGIQDFYGMGKFLVEFNPRAKLIFDDLELEHYRELVLSWVGMRIERFIQLNSEVDEARTVSYASQLVEEMIFAIEASPNLVDERVWFAWKQAVDNNFNSDGPEFNEQYQLLINQGEEPLTAIRSILGAAFEEVLIESANPRLRAYYESTLEKDPNNTRLQKNLARIDQVAQEADALGRKKYFDLLQAWDEPVELTTALGRVVVPENSITQVGPARDLFAMLQEGTLPDALLSGKAIDQEESMASHVATTSLVPGDAQTVNDRLPSYGNPRSTAVNRVYELPADWPYQPYGKLKALGSSYGMMGPAHQHVFGGIPSKFLRVIVVHDLHTLSSVKQQVARNGWYIPIVDSQGKILLAPEEFDTMQAIFAPLQQAGYPEAVLNSIYAYYLRAREADPNIGIKHRLVITKAVQQVQTEIANGQKSSIDLAILTSYLQSNDLNTHSELWYESSSMKQIMDSIRESTRSKLLQSAQNLVFTYKQENLRNPKPSLRSEVAGIQRKPHGFIDAFLDIQLPYIFVNPQELRESLSEAVRFLDWMLFDDLQRILPQSGQMQSGTIDVVNVESTAKYLTETRKLLLRRIWEASWDQLLADKFSGQKKLLTTYKQVLAPMVTGSIGRGETMLGSDLDYMLLVDDENLPTLLAGMSKEQFLEDLRQFVESSLAKTINDQLEQSGVRGDAGLAKESSQPLIVLSDIKEFEINFGLGRQAEEPTVILSLEPVYDSQLSLAQKARVYLYQNPDYENISLYIEQDMIKYRKNFMELYDNLVSQNMVQNVKRFMQRAITFKLYSYVSRAFQLGLLNINDLKQLPSNTWDLLEFLQEKDLLVQNEVRVAKELLAVSYKLRFLFELYSSADQATDKLPKVKRTQFRLKNIAYDERAVIIEAVKIFRNRILFKDPYEFVVKEEVNEEKPSDNEVSLIVNHAFAQKIDDLNSDTDCLSYLPTYSPILATPVFAAPNGVSSPCSLLEKTKVSIAKLFPQFTGMDDLSPRGV